MTDDLHSTSPVGEATNMEVYTDGDLPVGVSFEGYSDGIYFDGYSEPLQMTVEEGYVSSSGPLADGVHRQYFLTAIGDKDTAKRYRVSLREVTVKEARITEVAKDHESLEVTAAPVAAMERGAVEAVGIVISSPLGMVGAVQAAALAAVGAAFQQATTHTVAMDVHAASVPSGDEAQGTVHTAADPPAIPPNWEAPVPPTTFAVPSAESVGTTPSSIGLTYYLRDEARSVSSWDGDEITHPEVRSARWDAELPMTPSEQFVRLAPEPERPLTGRFAHVRGQQLAVDDNSLVVEPDGRIGPKAERVPNTQDPFEKGVAPLLSVSDQSALIRAPEGTTRAGDMKTVTHAAGVHEDGREANVAIDDIRTTRTDLPGPAAIFLGMQAPNTIETMAEGRRPLVGRVDRLHDSHGGRQQGDHQDDRGQEPPPQEGILEESD